MEMNFGSDQVILDSYAKRLLKYISGYIISRILFEWNNLISKDSLNNYIRINFVGKIKTFDIWSLDLFIIAAIDSAINRIILTAPNLLIIALFCVMIKGLILKFEIFNHFFEKCVEEKLPLNAIVIRKWRINRCDLQDMVYSLDDLFSPTIMMWVVFFVLGICVESMRFLTGKSLK